MGEQSGFSTQKLDSGENGNENLDSELPFQAERGFRSNEVESRPGSYLQALSPDKPLLGTNELDKLNPEQLDLLQRSLLAQREQCEKVGGPLRTVYNKSQMEKMNNSDQAESSSWALGYVDKVGGVLRDNINELSAEIPFRIAVPVQSFLPGQDGVVQAEKLYAFFPPLETNISDCYITFPLHSADAAREAQLRGTSSFGASISSHEFEFRCKMTKVGNTGVALMDRRSPE